MFIEREREESGGWGIECERDRNIDVREKHLLVASRLCPDQGLNPQPFGVWDDAPTNLATWPEPST